MDISLHSDLADYIDSVFSSLSTSDWLVLLVFVAFWLWAVFELYDISI